MNTSHNEPSLKNVVSVGDAVKECLAGLEAKAAESQKFFSKMREQISQIEIEYCAEHELQPLAIDDDQTMRMSWKHSQLTICYKQCPKCAKSLEVALVNEKWSQFGIPSKVLHATLDNFKTDLVSQEKAIKKVKQQIDKKSGFLILRGTPGTGKTHLASAVLKLQSGVFITEADLIAELRQTYADNEGQEIMVRRYRNAQILVLDELTTDIKGVDIPALLYRILGYRYDNDLLTVITSNETLEVILGIIGPRLSDRMKSNHTVITCEWASHRKPETQSS